MCLEGYVVYFLEIQNKKIDNIRENLHANEAKQQESQ